MFIIDLVGKWDSTAMIVVRFSLGENRQLKREKRIVDVHDGDILEGDFSDRAQFNLSLPSGIS